VDIVKAAVKASEHQHTTLNGGGYRLIILLYCGGMNNRGLYFRADKFKATKVFNINEMKQVLGSDLCSQLLFIQALTGCDSAARANMYQAPVFLV